MAEPTKPPSRKTANPVGERAGTTAPGPSRTARATHMVTRPVVTTKAVSSIGLPPWLRPRFAMTGWTPQNRAASRPATTATVDIHPALSRTPP